MQINFVCCSNDNIKLNKTEFHVLFVWLYFFIAAQIGQAAWPI